MKFLPGLLVCLLCAPAAFVSAQSPAAGTGSTPATPPSYAGESYVVERLSKDVVFAADGTGHEEQTVRVRILSDAALEEFGILRIPYRGDNQRVDVQATVTANGTVVSTPLADIQDLPSDVSREAPMYSDSREKHVPVRGLRVGSVLEFRVRLTRTKPDTPGFFWFTHSFTTENIVLDETLNITVPADKYVQVKSPRLTPAVEQRGGTKVYSWKNANTSRSPDNKVASSTAPPDVQLTSFRNWDEVGRWYRDLQSPQVVITPAIQAKAAELTAGLASDAEKQKAIYRFVATNFRYISLSFGQGRYQPHTAAEVLANAYGDCKDKHTLMSSLLTAAGLRASPALLAVGGSIDADVPSPAAMNHVITYLPGIQPTWVDTTTEIAPYGALPSYIRGVRALVIPDTGAAFLATTPERLPFAAEDSFLTTGTLTADGLLSGRISASYRGDAELQMRAAFRVTSRGQWPQLLARMINLETVREDKVEDPLNLDPPFTYSYAFERKDFFQPTQAMFVLPLPLMSRSYNPAAEKPAEPVFVGSAGNTTLRATLTLPEGFSVEVPTDVSVKTTFGDYVTSYRVAGNVLTAERHLVLKQERVGPVEWPGFQAFFKSVSDDEQQLVMLVRRARDVPVVVRSSKEANELILKARDSMLARDFRRTLDLLGQAERINSTERLLWASYATVYGLQGQAEKALDAMKKEVLYHPERDMYRLLIDLQLGMHRTDEAIASLREVLTLNPADVEAAVKLSSSLVEKGKHAEAISVAETAIRAGASDPELRIALGHAFLGAGRKAEGATTIVKALEGSADSSALNNAAYALAEDGLELPAAADLANRSAAKLAADSSQLALVSLTESDLHNVLLLTLVWDTQGWVAFKRGDLKTAETFLSAAWTWTQRAVIGYHLGQVYEAEHNRALAIRTYQLAREANVPRNEHIGQQIKDRLDKIALGNAAANSSSDVAGDLSRMRTVAVPNKAGGATGQADFLILLSKKGVEDAALVTGGEALRPMTKAITALRFELPFPDDGPERMVRRGILSCPTAGSNCSMILLLTGDTTK